MAQKHLIKDFLLNNINSGSKILKLNVNKYYISNKPYFKDLKCKEDLKMIKIAMEKFSFKNNLFEFDTKVDLKTKSEINDNNTILNKDTKNAINKNIEYQKVYGKDDEYWNSYSKRVKKGKSLLSPLDSQEFQINETDKNWKYYKNHSLLSSELYDELVNLSNENSPFILLDIREDSELELYNFPLRNKKGVILPIVHRTVNDLNYKNYNDIPLDKFIVVIDSIGIRSRRICHQLMMELGCVTMYVEGGLDKLLLHIKKNGI